MTPDPNSQVVVVGAGPAGSITALLLARAGVGVRLLDRSRFPRHKLCGDTLNPGALATLDRLGVAAPIRGRGLRVDGMIVTGPGDVSVAGAYGRDVHGVAITRHDLDVLLLEAAIAAGAQFDDDVDVRAPVMEGTRVAGVRLRAAGGEETIRAAVTVAADGRHSRLAFGLGLSRFASHPRRWAFGAYYAGVDGLTAFGEMHVRPNGYIGIAPVPGGAANVCVVRARDMRAPGAFRGDVITKAIAAEPAIRIRFARASRVSDVTVLGPLAVESYAAGMPGLLLAGDAAGFIDPMTGDGLRFAIRGAELAAASVLCELETGTAQYMQLAAGRRLEFATKWRMNRALRGLVGSQAGVRAAAAVASIWSAPVAQLIPFAGDVPAARRMPHA